MLKSDFSSVFYPKLCVGCETNLHSNENVLCVNCRHDLPIIKLNNYRKNEITSLLYGRVIVNKMAAFLYYNKEGVTKRLIHDLKYKKNQNIGVFLADWFGNILNDYNFFKDIDVIVPVPLHGTKYKERGYNQLTTFGRTLSDNFTIDYNASVLRRISNAKTQTTKNRFDRFSNINTKFNLTNLTCFENKHILLIDDVITTGATIEACCLELRKTNNITISVLTMAFSKR